MDNNIIKIRQIQDLFEEYANCKDEMDSYKCAVEAYEIATVNTDKEIANKSTRRG